jgi:hypothetical protein
MYERRDFLCSGFAALIGDSLQLSGVSGRQDHIAWVIKVLEEMLTVKPDMTREQLLKVFVTEGGLSTGLQRTYASRQCPYFKVDVKFRAVGRPDRDRNERVTLVEDNRDVITSISEPYLQFAVSD